jgi:hypothetical protein
MRRFLKLDLVKRRKASGHIALRPMPGKTIFTTNHGAHRPYEQSTEAAADDQQVGSDIALHGRRAGLGLFCSRVPK